MSIEEFRIIEEMLEKRDKQHAEIIAYLNYLAGHFDNVLSYIYEKDPEWVMSNIPEEIRLRRIGNRLDPDNRINF